MDATQMKQQPVYMYQHSDIDWQRLAALNIYPLTLDDAGQMERFLSGEETEVIHLNINMYGFPIEMDAVLKIVEEDGNPPYVTIRGISGSESDEIGVNEPEIE